MDFELYHRKKKLFEPVSELNPEIKNNDDLIKFMMRSEDYTNIKERDLLLKMRLAEDTVAPEVYVREFHQIVRYGSPAYILKYVQECNLDYGREFWEHIIAYIARQIFNETDPEVITKFRAAFKGKGDTELVELFNLSVAMNPDIDAEIYVASVMLFPETTPKMANKAFHSLSKHEPLPACIELFMNCAVTHFDAINLKRDDVTRVLSRYLNRQYARCLLPDRSDGKEHKRYKKVMAANKFLKSTLVVTCNIFDKIGTPGTLNPIEHVFTKKNVEVKHNSDLFLMFFLSSFDISMFDIKNGDRIVPWNSFFDENVGVFRDSKNPEKKFPPRNVYAKDFKRLAKIYEFVRFNDKSGLLKKYGYEKFIQYFAMSLAFCDQHDKIEKVFLHNKSKMTTKHGVLTVFLNTMLSRAKRGLAEQAFELWVRIVRICIEWDFMESYEFYDPENKKDFVDMKYSADIATRLLLNALFVSANKVGSDGWHKYGMLILHIADQTEHKFSNTSIIKETLDKMAINDAIQLFTENWHNNIRTVSTVAFIFERFNEEFPELFEGDDIPYVLAMKCSSDTKPEGNIYQTLYQRYMNKDPIFECLKDVPIEEDCFNVSTPKTEPVDEENSRPAFDWENLFKGYNPLDDDNGEIKYEAVTISNKYVPPRNAFSYEHQTKFQMFYREPRPKKVLYYGFTSDEEEEDDSDSDDSYDETSDAVSSVTENEDNEYEMQEIIKNEIDDENVIENDSVDQKIVDNDEGNGEDNKKDNNDVEKMELGEKEEQEEKADDQEKNDNDNEEEEPHSFDPSDYCSDDSAEDDGSFSREMNYIGAVFVRYGKEDHIDFGENGEPKAKMSRWERNALMDAYRREELLLTGTSSIIEENFRKYDDEDEPETERRYSDLFMEEFIDEGKKDTNNTTEELNGRKEETNNIQVETEESREGRNDIGEEMNDSREELDESREEMDESRDETDESRDEFNDSGDGVIQLKPKKKVEDLDDSRDEEVEEEGYIPISERLGIGNIFQSNRYAPDDVIPPIFGPSSSLDDRSKDDHEFE